MSALSFMRWAADYHLFIQARFHLPLRISARGCAAALTPMAEAALTAWAIYEYPSLARLGLQWRRVEEDSVLIGRPGSSGKPNVTPARSSLSGLPFTCA